MKEIWPVTIENIKKWAYDEDLCFSEQDEDLLMYHSEYVPVLLEVARDENCPKCLFAYSIAWEYTKEIFLRQDKEEIEKIIEIKNIVMKQRGLDIGDSKWISYVDRLSGYYYNSKPVDRIKAEEMGKDLLMGFVSEGGEFEIKSSLFRWKVCSKYMCLSINKRNGKYSYHNLQ